MAEVVEKPTQAQKFDGVQKNSDFRIEGEQENNSKPEGETTTGQLTEPGTDGKGKSSACDTKSGNITASEIEEKRSNCHFLKKLPPVRVLMTLAACLAAEFTLGVSYSTGNVLPYLTSYLRNATGETSADYTTVLWVDNTFLIISYVAMPFAGVMLERLNERVYLLIGTMAIGLSFAGTRLAVEKSLLLVVLVFGLFHGLGQAMMWPALANIAMRWFPERKGFFGATVMAGYGIGAFAWNQVASAWINPHNLQPDQRVGEDLYFTQPEVLNNVPSYYLMMGGVLSGILLLCVICIQFPPPLSSTETIPVQNPDSPPNSEKVEKEELPAEMTKRPLEDDDSPSVADVGKKADDSPKYSPLDVFKARVTWTLWFIHLFLEIGFVLVWAFYKAYGQTFIRNDHLLALVGSFASVFESMSRPFWGWLADRIGYQPTILTGQIIMTVTMSTLILTEYVYGAGMFFAWVCLIYLGVSAYFSVMAPIIFAMFGSRYFLYHLGVVYSSGIIAFLLSALVVGAIKDLLGWHGVFLFAAGNVFISLLFNLSLLLNCGRKIPEHMKKELFFSWKRKSGSQSSRADK